MKEKQVLDKLKAAILNSTEGSISENGNDFMIQVFTGNVFWQYNLSVPIVPCKNAETLIDKLNGSHQLYKFKLENETLTISSMAWVDRKPTLKAAEETVRILMSELLSIKAVLEYGDE